MKVFLSGKKTPITLTKNDFIAQGGQASVYARGTTVYKLYTDPKAMIPPAKIAELQSLADPHVVKPEDILIDESGKPVGYTMPYLRDTHPLCKLFTKAFKTREGIGEEHVKRLVQQMRDTVEHVHRANVLIVDLNEMNCMVSPRFDDVYFIDVDSYQTRTYPATVLMESVRDRLTKGFSEVTDWFSFAVVTFQLFVGIHPFKGKHPKISTMDERMLASVSVLNKDVSVPATCSPFSVIPAGYFDWYTRLFEKGERVPPPEKVLGGFAVAVARVARAEKALFKIEEWLKVGDDVLDFFESESGGAYVIATSSNAYLGKHRMDTSGKGPYVFTPVSGKPIEVLRQLGERIDFVDAWSGADLKMNQLGRQVSVYRNRVHFLNGTNLMELTFWEQQAGKLMPQVAVVGQVMENSSKLFPGVCVQNVLGSWYASLLAEPGAAFQFRLKELDGHDVLDARLSEHILMVATSKGGKYYRSVLKFDDRFAEYKVFSQREVGSLTDLNFVVLPNRVAICLTDDDKVEVFSSKWDSDQVRVLEDKNVRDVKLFAHGGRAMFAKGDTIYRFSLQG